MFEPASRIQNVRYAIRNVVSEAAKLEAQGRRILYCNVGDPLKFDFATPPHLIEAVHRAMRDGHNGYAPSAGYWEAREAVAKEVGRAGIRGVSAEHVVITAGASESIEMTLTALLNPDENVLLPSPGYPLYNAVAAKLGVQVVPYQLDEAKGWSLDVEEIASKINPKTRGIVICNPGNPTGAVLDKAALEGLIQVARERKLVIFSDEIYDKLRYDSPHTPTATLTDDVPVLTFNGLSKSYLACGWRIGWVVFCNPHLTESLRGAVLRLADARLCAPAPPQFAIAPALEGPQDHLVGVMEKLRSRRDLMVRRMNSIRGISVVAPRGAFYAMPRIQLPGVVSDESFVLELLRATGVLFVHGSGFGQKPGTQHFRVVFLPPEDILRDAFDRLEQFVEERFPA